MRIFGSAESQGESNIPFLYNISAQEAEDEYYKMLQKISTHMVGYCLLMYLARYTLFANNDETSVKR